jgi:hypothetical protein
MSGLQISACYLERFCDFPEADIALSHESIFLTIFQFISPNHIRYTTDAPVIWATYWRLYMKHKTQINQWTNEILEHETSFY